MEIDAVWKNLPLVSCWKTGGVLFVLTLVGITVGCTRLTPTPTPSRHGTLIVNIFVDTDVFETAPAGTTLDTPLQYVWDMVLPLEIRIVQVGDDVGVGNIPAFSLRNRDVTPRPVRVLSYQPSFEEYDDFGIRCPVALEYSGQGQWMPLWYGNLMLMPNEEVEIRVQVLTPQYSNSFGHSSSAVQQEELHRRWQQVAEDVLGASKQTLIRLD
jgi:hypothetical protein